MNNKYKHTELITELSNMHNIVNTSNNSEINSLLLKTALSRNITIEMWNTIIKYIIQFLKIFGNLYNTCKIIDDFLNLIDTDMLNYNNLSDKPTLNGTVLQGDVSIPSVDIATILNLD